MLMLFTRLLGLAPESWAFRPTAGFCAHALGPVPRYWDLHPTTGFPLDLRGIAGMIPATGLRPRNF